MLRILGLREGEMGLSAERLKTHIGADELKTTLRGLRQTSPAPSPKAGNGRDDPFSTSTKHKPKVIEEEATPIP